MLKGNEFEVATKKWLEAHGWVVHRARASYAKRLIGHQLKHWRVSHDLWGCIDNAAMHLTRGFWFIQNTTQHSVSRKRREVERLPWPRRRKGLRLRAGVRVSVFESRSRKVEGSRKRQDYVRVHDWDGTDWSVTEELFLG